MLSLNIRFWTEKGLEILTHTTGGLKVVKVITAQKHVPKILFFGATGVYRVPSCIVFPVRLLNIVLGIKVILKVSFFYI